jgi:MFS family permease
MLQGLALGGEYGGAATYVAEHSRRTTAAAIYTSWIQTTATLGLFLSLLIILGVAIQTAMTKEAFAAWGWRIPFLLSFILLGISVWIRLSAQRIADVPSA